MHNFGNIIRPPGIYGALWTVAGRKGYRGSSCELRMFAFCAHEAHIVLARHVIQASYTRAYMDQGVPLHPVCCSAFMPDSMIALLAGSLQLHTLILVPS